MNVLRGKRRRDKKAPSQLDDDQSEKLASDAPAADDVLMDHEQESLHATEVHKTLMAETRAGLTVRILDAMRAGIVGHQNIADALKCPLEDVRAAFKRLRRRLKLADDERGKGEPSRRHRPLLRPCGRSPRCSPVRDTVVVAQIAVHRRGGVVELRRPPLQAEPLFVLRRMAISACLVRAQNHLWPPLGILVGRVRADRRAAVGGERAQPKAVAERDVFVMAGLAVAFETVDALFVMGAERCNVPSRSGARVGGSRGTGARSR